MPTNNGYLVFAFICIMVLNAVAALAQPAKKTILFVCEHGSAKSIVAAEHFNRLAEKEGIRIKVISRGTNPDEIVPQKINTLLNADGFQSHTEKPLLLTSEDIQAADYIVAFNPIPVTFGKIPNLEMWNIPSIDAGYPAARDSILVNINRIIQRIKTDNQK